MPNLSIDTVRALPRRAYRKAIYRQHLLDRYEIAAADSQAPSVPFDLSMEFIGPEGFDRVLGTNPYLTNEDIEQFARQRSTCIVVHDGDRVASTSWMTAGDVFVHELQRELVVPTTEHFSCRSYVDPDYRGRALFGHMIHSYSLLQPPGDTVWGLVYGWNTASVLSIERIGWRCTGEYWTRWILGSKRGGERHFQPRSPSDPK